MPCQINKSVPAHFFLISPVLHRYFEKLFFHFLKEISGFALFRNNLIILAALATAFAETKLEDLQYLIRQNGVEIHLSYSTPLEKNKIIVWKSNQRWIYLTLLDVKSPPDQYPVTGLSGPISSIVLDDFDGSTQLSFMFKRPILGYDVVNIPTNNGSKLFVHLAEPQVTFFGVEATIVGQDNEKTSSPDFPEYDAEEYIAAFNRARAELGANAIFKHFGNYYITTYPNEYKEQPISGFVTDVGEQTEIPPESIQEKEPTTLAPITPSESPTQVPTIPSPTQAPTTPSPTQTPTIPSESVTLSPTMPSESPTEAQKVLRDAIVIQKIEEINLTDRVEDNVQPKPIYLEPIKKHPPFKPAMVIQNSFEVQASVSDSFSIVNQDGFQPSQDMPAESPFMLPELIKWYEQIELSQAELDKKMWYRIQKRFKSSLSAGVRVTSNMDGIPIYVDGKMIGRTPLAGAVKVEPGWHQVSGFSPVFAQIVADGGLYELGADQITRNKQLFGSKMVYVDTGKVIPVNLKFNQITPEPRKKLEQRTAGMMVGFPVIIALFGFITWGFI